MPITTQIEDIWTNNRFWPNISHSILNKMLGSKDKVSALYGQGQLNWFKCISICRFFIFAKFSQNFNIWKLISMQSSCTLLLIFTFPYVKLQLCPLYIHELNTAIFHLKKSHLPLSSSWACASLSCLHWSWRALNLCSVSVSWLRCCSEDCTWSCSFLSCSFRSFSSVYLTTFYKYSQTDMFLSIT